MHTHKPFLMAIFQVSWISHLTPMTQWDTKRYRRHTDDTNDKGRWRL